MIDISKVPFQITWRELWLPASIIGNTRIPAAISGGHPAGLTGARLGSTADGVHFTGAATSNINCGAIHNNAATFWIDFRFKFDQGYATGYGDQYIWGKWLDATHFLWLVFKSVDGKFYFEGQDGGVNDFSIAAQDGAADITSWNEGQWYHVLASISAVNNVRFRIDNGTVVTNASAIAFPNGGDFVYGDYDDPGAGTGFEGIIVDFRTGTDDLSANEETDLSKGVPPADTVNEYLLDEGRGVTAYDRGSGGNNGTLDTSCRWEFGQVRQPVLSLDGINDQALIGTEHLYGDLTLVWVGKLKSTYSGLSSDRYLIQWSTDGNNWITIHYHAGTNRFRFIVEGNNVQAISTWIPTVSIDDYVIIICTATQDGTLAFTVNGSLTHTTTGAGPRVKATVTNMFIGQNGVGAAYDISKPMLVGVAETALSLGKIKILASCFNDSMDLPISI